MSTTVEAPQAETLAAAAPPREDLSKYDSRRAIARAVDGVFVGAPFLIPVLGLGFALSVALVAICLLYFFVCEALWGQTLGKRLLGLRVLMRDGGPRPRRPSACARRRGSSRTARSASPSSSPPASAAGGSATCSATRSSRAPRPACRAPASPPPDRRPRGHRGRRDRGRARLLRALRAPGLPARRRQDVCAQHGRRCGDARARGRRDRRPHGRRPPQARRGRDTRQRAQAARGDPRARRLRHPRGGSGRTRRDSRARPTSPRSAVARQRAAKRYAQLGLRACAGL